ncbi:MULTISPECIES: hypothetical protein [Psychrilyobacter]|uniref:Altered inheritance of mitochondria protein 6 n=1 Tax=Psychrilyobacter piezotolerans TaxID=2293438 RepID=A0ABX9KIG5_9FUSO|nr:MULTISPECIES: hypothetical protein [Psychrilyobacter]MCS5420612.1 hypothetical protein [Psychrilyobacter sp. S5]NDI77369.1 hypothetical protein [Psychrilyobacter piezotolerans]RDE63674.1 hypothetical protein DV867_04665 [Psychrilyobacter sp. S5]REI42018.1 hypothetical protein DYH56_04665 [Psychrilyobacter piezotolerans]
MKKIIIVLNLLLSVLSFGESTKYYMPNAHSHNDYLQEQPLILALKNGMSSIEADIWLRTDSKGVPNLYVAHDEEEITPDRTLEDMYLKPLTKFIAANKGVVYNNKDEKVFLHVDLKTTNKETWDLLQEVAGKYSHIFTQYLPDGTIKEGAVTIFTNVDYTSPDSVRYSTKDGRFGDIYSNDNWKNYFTNAKVTPIVSSGLWKYNDPKKSFNFKDEKLYKEIISEFNAPLSKEKRLNEVNTENASVALSKNYKLLYKYLAENKVTFSDYFINQMNLANEIGHEHGVLIRFWNSPDNIDMWNLLKPLKSVMINTGNLQELREFILED